jgi:hypothetical protein
MPLTKLQFRPGVNRETTSYTNEGGWFDCDKIRFRFGTPEKIGGWQKTSGTSYLGTTRALHPFVALDGTRFLGLGTNLKYYVDEGGAFNDITPIRSTTSAGDVVFAATNGSSTITITDADHGALAGDFVTFSGAASLGGTITAAVLNQEYEIVSVTSSSVYTITARTVSTISQITVSGALVFTAVVANGSDSGNGGGSIIGTYQVNIGLDTTVTGTGWGAGTWGRGTWGSSASLLVSGSTLRIWTHDNLGEDLLINVRDAGIFYWDKSTRSAPFLPAQSLSSLSSDATTPTIAKQVLVSDVDRHVIVFGCDAQDNIGVQDPLLIRFSDQGQPLIWESLATNTAGDLSLGSGSEIITAVETKQQIMVWTDSSLHAMQFIGPPFTFGITQVAENITIASPMSAVAVDDNIFWMGVQDFYVYSGQVQKLPCSVRSYVFNDFNASQSEKVCGGVNSSFSEIWWFYPSSSSAENNRYVVYNYQEKVWYYGVLSRTAWLDRGINTNPISASTDNYLYLQDFGLDDGSTSPASAVTSYIESSQMDIGDGDSFVFLQRLIPDITFSDSTAESPSANFTLETRNYPGAAYTNSTTNPVVRSATVPVEQFTNVVNVRLRGRSFALKVESVDTGVGWRLGSPRVDLRQDGRR